MPVETESLCPLAIYLVNAGCRRRAKDTVRSFCGGDLQVLRFGRKAQGAARHPVARLGCPRGAADDGAGWHFSRAAPFLTICATSRHPSKSSWKNNTRTRPCGFGRCTPIISCGHFRGGRRPTKNIAAGRPLRRLRLMRGGAWVWLLRSQAVPSVVSGRR